MGVVNMSLNTQEILLKYHSFADGLTSNEALVRQRKYGLNKIEQEEHKTVFSFLFKSFKVVSNLCGAS